jgi:hypothetical protein
MHDALSDSGAHEEEGTMLDAYVLRAASGRPPTQQGAQTVTVHRAGFWE